MPVREATLADVPRIVELGSRSLVDGPYAGVFEDNPAQSEKFATQIIVGLGKVLLWETDEGHIAGLLGFLVAPHYFSGVITATEIMWYVEKSHREGGSA